MKTPVKWLALSVVVVCVIAGCSKQQEAKPTAPQQSIQPPSRKIFGAFGWQLGQTIPSTQEVSYVDGKMTVFIDAKGYPPFEGGALTMTKDRHICTIQAWCNSPVSPQSVDMILATLTNKYGPVKQHNIDPVHANKQTWWIEDGFASIAFNLYGDGSIAVIYNDDQVEISTKL
jgi:hypothetical protein